MTRPFVPDSFEAPYTVPSAEFVLIKLTPALVELDYDAVMSSKERLRQVFSRQDPWPRDAMTLEENRADLERHASDFDQRLGFTYSVLSLDQQQCLGCLYIYPWSGQAHDAQIYYWVRDSAQALDAHLDRFVQDWVAQEWPFKAPAYPGRQISWDAWEALSNDVENPEI
jgi:hypothetical protein